MSEVFIMCFFSFAGLMIGLSYSDMKVTLREENKYQQAMLSMVDRHIELIEETKRQQYPKECREELSICDSANWMLIQEHNRMSDKIEQAIKVVEAYKGE